MAMPFDGDPEVWGDLGQLPAVPATGEYLEEVATVMGMASASSGSDPLKKVANTFSGCVLAFDELFARAADHLPVKKTGPGEFTVQNNKVLQRVGTDWECSVLAPERDPVFIAKFLKFICWDARSSEPVAGVPSWATHSGLLRTAGVRPDGSVDWYWAKMWATQRRGWVPVGMDLSRPVSGADFRDSFIANAMTHMALFCRYSWMVELAYPGCVPVAFPTDAVGIRAMFKDRDIEPGRHRRDALKHWVGEHWRQARKDAEAEDYVRKHLRGAERFTWNGMECQVQISQLDANHVEDLKSHRIALKKKRESRRRRGVGR